MYTRLWQAASVISVDYIVVCYQCRLHCCLLSVLTVDRRSVARPWLVTARTPLPLTDDRPHPPDLPPSSIHYPSHARRRLGNSHPHPTAHNLACTLLHKDLTY